MAAIVLPLHQRYPFASCPAVATPQAERVSAEGAIFPGEYNPHRVRLFALGDVDGCICAVWAGSLQDALDNACDAGFLGDHQLEETGPDIVRDETTGEETHESLSDFLRLGNASEPFGFDQLWAGEVKWEEIPERIKLQFAETRGQRVETLDDIR